MAAEITDEGIAALRARIGVPQPHPQPPHYRRPNEDAFRHVAEAYGDDNPLWSDPAHGAASRWDGAIAPPHLVGGDTLIGENEVTGYDDETKALMKGDPLRGVHAFYSGSYREWWNPLHPGARITRRNALVGVHDKVGEFAGRAVHEWTGEVFCQQDGPPLAAQYRLMIRGEREKAEASGKYDDTEIRPYTDEDIERITEAVLAEADRRRGTDPRWWEDVAEGDELGPSSRDRSGSPTSSAGTSGWAWASTA